MILDDQRDLLGVHEQAHLHRPRPASVSVEHDVVARLAHRGLQIIQELRLDPQHLTDPGQHAAHDCQGLRSALQIQPDGGGFSDHGDWRWAAWTLSPLV